MGKTGITLIFILLSGFIVAQSNRDFNYYNGLTYSQYLAGNWKDLIETGKQSLDAGFDSYYIRMRLGIAYYSQTKYRQAERQFRAALVYDTNSPATKEYLYYTNLFLGREQEAFTYYDIRKDPVNPFFHSLYIEGGLKINPSELTYTGNVYYGMFAFRHQFSPRVRYFHAYQHLKRGLWDKGQGQGQQADQLYYVNQNEYYGKFEILAGHNFWLMPAFHYQTWSLPGSSDDNWLASIGIAKDLGLTRLYVEGNWSNINNSDQMQVNAGLVIYPLGNLNFYLDNVFIYQNDSAINQLGGRHLAGGRIGKTSWIQGWYAYGPMRYFNEHNGLVVFNSLNTINQRMGLSFIQLLGKHEITFHFIRENKTEAVSNLDFIHNNFVLGLNFKLF